MKILSKKIYENEIFISSITNEYNSQGQLIRQNGYNNDNILTDYKEYFYDSSGNCIIEKSYIINNNDYLYMVKRAFDIQNRLIKEIYSDEGFIEEWTEYSYPDNETEIIIYKDDEGKIICRLFKNLKTGIWEHQNAYGKTTSREKLTFDSKGRMLKRIKLDKNVSPQLIEHKYSMNEKIEEWSMYFNDNLNWKKYREYNDNNQIISSCEKDGLGNPTYIINYQYDKYGNEILWTFFGKEKKIVRKFVIKYLNDSNE